MSTHYNVGESGLRRSLLFEIKKSPEMKNSLRASFRGSSYDARYDYPFKKASALARGLRSSVRAELGLVNAATARALRAHVHAGRCGGPAACSPDSLMALLPRTDGVCIALAGL